MRESLLATARQAILQGRVFEEKAEKFRLEAERAFEDVQAMKAEGRRRAAVQQPRMLPSHERATDVKTNTVKAMADAKGDNAYYSGQSAMYANLAAMKYAKAQALMARHALGLEGMPGG